MMSSLRFRVVLLSASMSLAACNMVTGAGDFVLVDAEEDDSGSDNSGAGVGGSTGNGITAGPGTGAGTGSGGDTGSGGNMGSGGDPSTTTGPTTTSTGATTATTTGATTATTTGATSSSSGGGEMCGGAGPTTTPLDGEEQAFMTLINNYRMQNGLGPLTPCVSLNRAAQGHSEDMRDNNYFSHTGLNNSTPWERSCDACFDLGCGPMTAMAENIAAGNSGAQATFTQWQNSPGHNANMLNGNFTMIGVGRATGGGQYGVYWTNVFSANDEPSCY